MDEGKVRAQAVASDSLSYHLSLSLINIYMSTFSKQIPIINVVTFENYHVRHRTA